MAIGHQLSGYRGLGESPGYYCYDANRPSWLPYWIDDPAESACKWSLSTIGGDIVACATGSPSCGTPTGSALDPTKSGAGIDPSNPNVPQCTSMFQSYDPTQNQCVTSPWIYYAGIALVGLVLVAKVI